MSDEQTENEAASWPVGCSALLGLFFMAMLVFLSAAAWTQIITLRFPIYGFM